MTYDEDKGGGLKGGVLCVECELRAKLCFCILCLWLELNSFQERYVCFYVFMFTEVVPGDTA